jgi:hemerythrin
MPLITWTDNMLVHVEIIDNQHKKLVALLNDLDEALNQKREKDQLAKTITALAEYTFYHFMTEEKYFDQFQYPETLHHKNEHQYFVEKITEFQQSYDQGEATLTTDIIQFLKSWIINHIQKSDRKYAPLFNAKGLT